MKHEGASKPPTGFRSSLTALSFFLATASVISTVSCATISPVNGIAAGAPPPNGKSVVESPTPWAGIIERTAERTEARFIIRETLPVLEDSIPAAPAVNARIEEAVAAAEQAFIAACAEARGLELSAPWEFVVDWEFSELTPDRFSALLEIYSYTGGAHGEATLVPLNFDAVSGTEILLADLWKASPGGTAADDGDWAGWLDWLERLSDLSETKLERTLEASQGRAPDAEWIEKGTAPEEVNFRIFTLKDRFITFRFAQYQVAPYSSGMPAIEISLDALRANPNVSETETK